MDQQQKFFMEAEKNYSGGTSGRGRRFPVVLALFGVLLLGGAVAWHYGLLPLLPLEVLKKKEASGEAVELNTASMPPLWASASEGALLGKMNIKVLSFDLKGAQEVAEDGGEFAVMLISVENGTASPAMFSKVDVFLQDSKGRKFEPLDQGTPVQRANPGMGLTQSFTFQLPSNTEIASAVFTSDGQTLRLSLSESGDTDFEELGEKQKAVVETARKTARVRHVAKEQVVEQNAGASSQYKSMIAERRKLEVKLLELEKCMTAIGALQASQEDLEKDINRLEKKDAKYAKELDEYKREHARYSKAYTQSVMDLKALQRDYQKASRRDKLELNNAIGSAQQDQSQNLINRDAYKVKYDTVKKNRESVVDELKERQGKLNSIKQSLTTQSRTAGTLEEETKSLAERIESINAGLKKNSGGG